MYMENQCYPFVNLPLPYPADALEPFLDEKTMRLHHDRHLKTYIDNLNAVLADCVQDYATIFRTIPAENAAISIVRMIL